MILLWKYVFNNDKINIILFKERYGDNMNKMEELLSQTKLCDILNKKPVVVVKDEKKCKNKLVCVFAVIGIIAALAGIGYAIYKYFKPDYLEDFEDDFEDDDFDDDFFEEDDKDSEE